MGSEILSSRLEGAILVVETPDGAETYDAKFLVAAMLVDVARGSGRIEPEESSQIIALIEEHYHLEGAESLELITRAMSELTEKPGLLTLLKGLTPTLSDAEKEEIALMGLKVVAADGRREVSELEQFSKAMETMDISPEIVHRAFDRYFEQTMPGS